jgi:hypothetical protein
MRDTIHGYIQFHAIGLSVMPMVIDFCTLDIAQQYEQNCAEEI